MSFDRREKLTGAKLFALGLKKTEKNGEREIRRSRYASGTSITDTAVAVKRHPVFILDRDSGHLYKKM